MCPIYYITSGVPHLLHHPVHSKARWAMPSTIQEAVSYHHRWLLQQLLYFFTMSIFFVTDVVESNSTSKVCLRPLQRICGWGLKSSVPQWRRTTGWKVELLLSRKNGNEVVSRVKRWIFENIGNDLQNMIFADLQHRQYLAACLLSRTRWTPLKLLTRSNLLCGLCLYRRDRPT